MTLGEFQARQIVKSARIFCTFLRSTREDRLNWRPQTEAASETRSILEMAGECVFANRRFLAIFTGQPLPTAPPSFAVFETVDEACHALIDSAETLALEVAKLHGEGLERVVTTHRGPMPAALAMQFPVRNMTYHFGQLNLIQMLYGDTEFHINEEFVTL